MLKFFINFWRGSTHTRQRYSLPKYILIMVISHMVDDLILSVQLNATTFPIGRPLMYIQKVLLRLGERGKWFLAQITDKIYIFPNTVVVDIFAFKLFFKSNQGLQLFHHFRSNRGCLCTKIKIIGQLVTNWFSVSAEIHRGLNLPFFKFRSGRGRFLLVFFSFFFVEVLAAFFPDDFLSFDFGLADTDGANVDAGVSVFWFFIISDGCE